MVEIGKVLGEGFDIWKRNLKICLSFVFSTLLILLIYASLFVIAFISEHFTQKQGRAPHEITLWIILAVFIFFVIFLIIPLIIMAYFRAGAIGMAKEAYLRGETSLRDMTYYGSKKFLDLLAAFIILAIPFIILVILGLTFPLIHIGEIIYILIISIVFALTEYAVVIGDLGPLEGVKTAFKMFREHKLDVFLMWIIVLIIALIIESFGYFIDLLILNDMSVDIISIIVPVFGYLILNGAPDGIISIIVSLVIVQPLEVVWWSVFYLQLAPTHITTQGNMGKNKGF